MLSKKNYSYKYNYKVFFITRKVNLFKNIIQKVQKYKKFKGKIWRKYRNYFYWKNRDLGYYSRRVKTNRKFFFYKNYKNNFIKKIKINKWGKKYKLSYKFFFFKFFFFNKSSLKKNIFKRFFFFSKRYKSRYKFFGRKLQKLKFIVHTKIKNKKYSRFRKFKRKVYKIFLLKNLKFKNNIQTSIFSIYKNMQEKKEFLYFNSFKLYLDYKYKKFLFKIFSLNIFSKINTPPLKFIFIKHNQYRKKYLNKSSFYFKYNIKNFSNTFFKKFIFKKFFLKNKVYLSLNSKLPSNKFYYNNLKKKITIKLQLIHNYKKKHYL